MGPASRRFWLRSVIIIGAMAYFAQADSHAWELNFSKDKTVTCDGAVVKIDRKTNKITQIKTDSKWEAAERSPRIIALEQKIRMLNGIEESIEESRRAKK